MLTLGWLTDVLIVYLVRSLVHRIKRRGSARWPRGSATVLVSRPSKGYGGGVAEIIYSYSHQGRYFSGTHKKPFISYGSVKEYAAAFPKGSQIAVRIKPDVPTTSIVRDDDQSLPLFRI